jgi:hypothetical protein
MVKLVISITKPMKCKVTNMPACHNYKEKWGCIVHVNEGFVFVVSIKIKSGKAPMETK